MVLDSVRKDMLRVARIPAGYAYDFPMTSEMLESVQHMVELERQCCRFLTFTINQSDSSIRLEITGPETAIPMIVLCSEMETRDEPNCNLDHSDCRRHP
jgi:hypothetical protein